MKKINTILLSITMVLLILSITSCEKARKPYSGIKTIVNYDLMETTINFQFIDAATGNSIGSNGEESINLSFYGENKDQLLDMTGSLYDSYKSDRGFVITSVHPNIEISQNNPFVISAIASAPGYITNTEQLKIYEKGETMVVMKMVKLESPPSGVTVKEVNNIATITGGSVVEEVNISTSGNEIDLTIPKGIKMKTKDGVELSGKLSVMMAHFDNMSEEALESFPGGLICTANIQGNKQQDIIFESAGFLALEITDSNGNKAAEFENETLDLSIKLNELTINPETGTPVKEGDEIPLFSLNEDTGEWLFEKTTIVVKKDGELFVETDLPHLSYWNLDWWYSPNCTNENTNARLKFTGDQSILGDRINVRFTIRRQSNGSYMKSYWKYAYLNQEIRLDNVPRGLPVYFEFETTSSGCGSSTGYNFETNPLYIDDLCELNTYEIAVSPQPNNNIQMLSINVEGYCPDNPDIIVRPTYSGYIRPSDNYCWQYVQIINGVASVSLDMTRTYIAGTYTYSGWHQAEFSPSDVEENYVGIEMPVEICNSY